MNHTDPTADLRKAIANVLRPHASLGGVPSDFQVPFFDGATPSLPRISGWKPLNDVVTDLLAVLPEPTSRAAVLLDAADHLIALRDSLITDPETTGKFLAGLERGARELRRLAAEAQQQPGTEAPSMALARQAQERLVDQITVQQPAAADGEEQQDGAQP